jgi:hypothetical protein
MSERQLVQVIDFSGDFRPEDNGTVTVRFTLTGLLPDQVDGVVERVSRAIKDILSEGTGVESVEVRDLTDKLQ